MLFEIQGYIQDYFNRLTLVDTDGFAVHLSNKYFTLRENSTDEEILVKFLRIQTLFFASNDITNKSEFLRRLLKKIDNRYKKKFLSMILDFPGGTEDERRRFQEINQLTTRLILQEFTQAIESRAVDAFWHSRTKGNLRKKPEKIAQSLFSMFSKGALINQSGLLIREFQSGIGFVDIGLILDGKLDVIEIKVIWSTFTGYNQLEQYMTNEKLDCGYLLVFDASPIGKKVEIPNEIKVNPGMIKVCSININPVAPSSMN